MGDSRPARHRERTSGAIAGAPLAGAAVGGGVAAVMKGSDLVIPAGTISEVGLKHDVVLRR